MNISIDGEVEKPTSFAFDDLAKLSDQVPDVAEHVPKRTGGAVWLKSLLATVGLKPEARYIVIGSDGFAICVPLEHVAENTLIVYRKGNESLPKNEGGPFRVFVVGAAECGTAEVDTCANVKQLTSLRLTTDPVPDIGHTHD